MLQPNDIVHTTDMSDLRTVEQPGSVVTSVRDTNGNVTWWPTVSLTPVDPYVVCNVHGVVLNDHVC